MKELGLKWFHIYILTDFSYMHNNFNYISGWAHHEYMEVECSRSVPLSKGWNAWEINISIKKKKGRLFSYIEEVTIYRGEDTQFSVLGKSFNTVQKDHYKEGWD